MDTVDVIALSDFTATATMFQKLSGPTSTEAGALFSK